MQEYTALLLSSWENFFVITGTAAATLTGLMFVVVVLSTSLRRRPTSASPDAFHTPSVVHFCVVLFIAVLFNAPWQGLEIPALLLGIVGIGGTIYIFIIFRRFTHLDIYKPVLEDWMWHIVIPFICYITLFISALLFLGNSVVTMFFIGAVSLLFLLVGIHNSWDIVTFIATMLPRNEDSSQSS